MSDGRSERITLRMAAHEVEEIDDFLARHPEYPSRSELIRYFVMEGIQRENRGIPTDNGIRVVFNAGTMNVLEDFVDLGMFRDMEDAVNFLFRRSIEEKFVMKVLRELLESYRELNSAIDGYSEYMNSRNGVKIRKSDGFVWRDKK